MAYLIFGLFVLAPLVFATVYVVRRVKTCKCKKKVWAKLTDCSPCGANPLGVTVTMVEYHCRSCGNVEKSAY